MSDTDNTLESVSAKDRDILMGTMNLHLTRYEAVVLRDFINASEGFADPVAQAVLFKIEVELENETFKESGQPSEGDGLTRITREMVKRYLGTS